MCYALRLRALRGMIWGADDFVGTLAIFDLETRQYDPARRFAV